MGIIPSSSSKADSEAPAARRKTGSVDFAKLGPLKSKGTIGFAGYRDPTSGRAKKSNGIKKSSDDDAMSDDEEDASGDESMKRKPSNGVEVSDGDEPKDIEGRDLTAEEIQRRKELAEGVKKMQLKRQHSVDPPHRGSLDGKIVTPPGTSSGAGATATPGESSFLPSNFASSTSAPVATNTHLSAAMSADTSDVVGSPLKRQRASIAHDAAPQSGNVASASSVAASAGIQNALGLAPGSKQAGAPIKREVEDEEL